MYSVGGVWDPDTDAISVELAASYDPGNGTPIVITKNFKLSKSIAGQAGTDAKVANLVSSTYAINYDDQGINPSPSGAMPLTGSCQGFDSPHLRLTYPDSTDSGWIAANPNAFSVPEIASHFSVPKTYLLEVKDGSGGAIEASDSITIIATQEFDAPVDGIDAQVVSLTS